MPTFVGHDGNWLSGLTMAHRCRCFEISTQHLQQTVAASVIYVVLEDRGLSVDQNTAEWLNNISGGKVDLTHFGEVVQLLQGHGKLKAIEQE